MGIDEIKDKASELLSEHGDKIEEGLDKAADFVDDKTGGKHSEHIDAAVDKAKDFIPGGEDSSDTATDADTR
ncbi:MAG: antitoxin [Jiangellaceae bacterium]